MRKGHVLLLLCIDRLFSSEQNVLYSFRKPWLKKGLKVRFPVEPVRETAVSALSNVCRISTSAAPLCLIIPAYA